MRRIINAFEKTSEDCGDHHRDRDRCHDCDISLLRPADGMIPGLNGRNE